MKNTNVRPIFAFLLLASMFFAAAPAAVLAQTGSAAEAAAVSPERYAAALSAIEKRLETRRVELGIPGLSLVIVKDGKVIYAKGHGYKDLEKKIAVTPDTQFAIGSATKAFTALSVLMSQDDGKLSLDDSPKKALPYFKMYDPETEKAITIRDLLSHSSGLNRTDIAMLTGKLNREELIRVAGEAKPTAKLREKWQYQNLMFTAAGEAVAQVQEMPWDKFIEKRIFEPLGMTNSTLSMSEMAKTKDHSFGYSYNFDTKTAKKLPFRDIDEVAPAGSINSSANDMAKWLQFILNEGNAGDERLVSETAFAEWTKPQMKISPDGSFSYGLGWFLQDRNGKKVVQHGGNIDGFNSLVAMVPEENLGFVILTNVSASTLPNEMMGVIWKNIIDGPADPAKQMPAETADALAGKYHLAAANVDIEVKKQDGGLVMTVPGQPQYTLVQTAPREFKLDGAPAGFAVKFSPETGAVTEMELRQPQGNFTLPKLVAGTENTAKASAAAMELVGKYRSAEGADVEIKEAAGVVTLNIPGQQPYTLNERAADVFSLSPLPEAYSLLVKRGADKKITGIAVKQPEGEFPFERLTATETAAVSADELIEKAIEASGGEANIRKAETRIATFDIDLVHQGIKGFGTVYSKAPNKTATETTITALGKEIGKTFDYFDGKAGATMLTFAPTEEYTGTRLDDMRLQAHTNGLIDSDELFEKITVTGKGTVGDEECYVVEFEPKKGSKYREFYSAETFLLLKREGVTVSSTSSTRLPYTTFFSDYRKVDGVMLPFRVVTSSVSNGDVVITFKEIKTNVPIKDSVFAPRKLD